MNKMEKINDKRYNHGVVSLTNLVKLSLPHLNNYVRELRKIIKSVTVIPIIKCRGLYPIWKFTGTMEWSSNGTMKWMNIFIWSVM